MTDKTYCIVMLEFLPLKIKNAIAHLNLQYLYEIRLRAGQPTMINYQGKYQYLSALGVTAHKGKGVKCTMQDITDCVYRAGKYSVYSVEDQIKQGFLSAEDGVRIGLAGEYVFEKGQPLALRNFSSLCIRIPHEVRGCAQEIYTICMSDKVKNLLIASSPGIGKTTILRDLGRILSLNTAKNILICDERGELAFGEFGETCDVVKYADKDTAFLAGIRAMRPDVIITDEIGEKDCFALEKAVIAGVKVIAAAHLSKFADLLPKYKEIFDYIVILNEEKIGEVKEIYRKTEGVLERIC